MRAFVFAAACVLLASCSGDDSSSPGAGGSGGSGGSGATGGKGGSGNAAGTKGEAGESAAGAGATAGEAGEGGAAGSGGAPITLTGVTIAGLSAAVTVKYDAEDVPHVQCAKMADCFAVQGYLQARDRLFPMDYMRRTARSSLAELVGASGLAQDVQLRTLFITRAGHRVEEDLVSNLDASTKALLTSFVGGINAYLTELQAKPSELPGEYAQLPFAITAADIPAWTLEDTLALARLQQFELSESIEEETDFATFAGAYGPGAPLADAGKMNAWIRAAAPTGEQAHPLSLVAAADRVGGAAVSTPPRVALGAWQNVLASVHTQFGALRQNLHALRGAVGSNNWAVGVDKSATGAAMVANDPHLALQYPPLFHLAALTSSTASDNLDLTGGTFPGLPGALVGRGKHVGWGVTVVGYDVTDLYLEQFLPQASCATAAPCVSFNGEATAALVVPQTFNVRVGAGAAGVVATTSLTLASPPPAAVIVLPQHGPLIQAPDAGGHAVSVRWTGQEGNTQDLKAIIGLDTAVSVDGAISALLDYATGAQNFVLADDLGNIAYDPHALVPVRKFADARATTPSKLQPPWFPLPGDGSAEWGDGTSNCASASSTPVPASCWLDANDLPQAKNPEQGYLFTANADPIGVSDDNNPLAHPPYLSFDWDDSTGFRATQIQARLNQAITAHGTVSLADMESLQADHVSRPGMDFGAYIAALPTSQTDSANLVAAKAVLAQWAENGWDCPSGLLGVDPKQSPVDSTASVQQNSAGCFLFHVFLRTLLTNVFSDDLAVAKAPVDGLQAIKAMLFMLTDTSANNGASFCNDVSALGVVTLTHTCADQVNSALTSAYLELNTVLGATSKWTWGRVHTVQPVSFGPLTGMGYSPGPFARPGGAFTVDVGTPALAGSSSDFSYTAGGNVRHISIMAGGSPISEMQLPGPERDAAYPFSGPDLLGDWLENKYFNFLVGAQIDTGVVATQAFSSP